MLRAENIHKSFTRGANELNILRGLNLEIPKGEGVCIVGASGAGKSTFLHILGTLDRPTAGTVYFQGEDLFQKNDDGLAQFRNRHVGFVFQFHHLLNEFTALENIMMPARIGKLSLKEARRKAEELIEIMGIAERQSHYPTELSGGEQQRVAIARALVCSPDILIADEPTGNLDTVNSAKVQELFFDLKRQLNLTLIVATHDTQFARRFAWVLRMRDGQWDSL